MNKKIIVVVSAVTIFSLIPSSILMFIVLNFRTNQIAGKSMEPNFKSGEIWLVEKSNSAMMGDVVTYQSNSYLAIGRVLAVGGDTIKISQCLVFVNDKVLLEEYIDGQICTRGGTKIEEEETYTLNDDQVFVIGDNREESQDSRNIGFIDKKNIEGIILFKIK